MLDKEQEEVRHKTADLYHQLYSHTPNILYRQRYQELTLQTLPAPTPLPEPPAHLMNRSLELETLLTQVDQLLADLL